MREDIAYRLIHDANHNIGKNAELEKVPELHAKIKGLQNVCLTKIKDKCNSSKQIKI